MGQVCQEAPAPSSYPSTWPNREPPSTARNEAVDHLLPRLQGRRAQAETEPPRAHVPAPLPPGPSFTFWRGAQPVWRLTGCFQENSGPSLWSLAPALCGRGGGRGETSASSPHETEQKQAQPWSVCLTFRLQPHIPVSTIDWSHQIGLHSTPSTLLPRASAHPVSAPHLPELSLPRCPAPSPLNSSDSSPSLFHGSGHRRVMRSLTGAGTAQAKVWRWGAHGHLRSGILHSAQ